MEARVAALQTIMKNHSCAVNLLHLLDAMDSLMLDLDLPTVREKKSIARILKSYREFKSYLGVLQLETKHLFRKVRVIDKGTYSEVHMVRHNVSQKTFAMKCMKKSSLRNFSSVECDIMATGKSPWLVELCCSFQDKNNLYIVMDYLPGGDLHSLMCRGSRCEESARFYIAEIVLALEHLHYMGFIHCDVKPKNVLLDEKGHVKLADFGLCIKTDSMGRAYPKTFRGTVLYASPEMLQLQGNGGWVHRACDWWAVGIMLYEMILGRHPFYSHEPMETLVAKLMTADRHLTFPKDKVISSDARDMVSRLLTKRENRLDLLKIKSHPFFLNERWTFSTIRRAAAPLASELKMKISTCHCHGAGDKPVPVKQVPKVESFHGEQCQFIGFTQFIKDKLLCPSELLSNTARESKYRNTAAKHTKNALGCTASRDTHKSTKEHQQPNQPHKKTLKEELLRQEKEAHSKRNQNTEGLKKPGDTRHKEERCTVAQDQIKEKKKKQKKKNERFSFFGWWRKIFRHNKKTKTWLVWNF